jgi:hypothetical protein
MLAANGDGEVVGRFRPLRTRLRELQMMSLGRSDLPTDDTGLRSDESEMRRRPITYELFDRLAETRHLRDPNKAAQRRSWDAQALRHLQGGSQLEPGL